MNRKQAILAIRAAAGQGDMATCTRLYCENRISRKAYDQAIADGRALAAFCKKRDAAKVNQDAGISG